MLRSLALVLSLTSLAATACLPSASDRGGVREQGARSLQDRFDSLADAARTLPSVQIAQGEAFYRGAHSITADQRLRVVADGRIVGTFGEASGLYPLGQIKSIRLIKPNDAQQRYGQLGANGVIELILL